MSETITSMYDHMSDRELMNRIDRLTQDFYESENRLNDAIGEATRRGLTPNDNQEELPYDEGA